MKKLLAFILLLLSNINLYSQDNLSERKIFDNSYFGICTAFGRNQPIRFQTLNDDNAKYLGKESYSIGLKYLLTVSQKLKIEFGTLYSIYSINYEYPPPFIFIENSILESIKIISIPIIIKICSAKNYYVSSGTMFDFSLPRKKTYYTDRQTGFGLNLGAGKIFLINKFSIDIGPNIDLHSVVPIDPIKYQQRLIDVSIKVGLNYNLN